MLNKVCIMGRVTKKPELQTSGNGTVYCRFCIAVPRDYISRETEERAADFPDVIAWRGLAEFVGGNFDRGDAIIVEGKLRTKMLTRKDGSKVKSTTIEADNCYFGAVRRAPCSVSGFDPDEDNDADVPTEVSEDVGPNIPEDQNF